MSSFFWGFFFIYISFNLTVNQHILNILPPFVGYLLLVRGIQAMEAESPLFSSIRPFAVGMAIYTGILWLGDLLGITGQGSWLSVLLGLAATVISLYVSWAVVQAIRDVESRRGADLNSASLKTAWTVLVVAQAAAWVLTLLGSLLALLGVIAGLLGIIWFLVALWRSRKNYEGLPPLGARL